MTWRGYQPVASQQGLPPTSSTAVMTDQPDWVQSFPEPHGDDLRPMPSVRRSESGRVHAALRQRDHDELVLLLKAFTSLYGPAQLERCLEDAKR